MDTALEVPSRENAYCGAALSHIAQSASTRARSVAAHRHESASRVEPGSSTWPWRMLRGCRSVAFPAPPPNLGNCYRFGSIVAADSGEISVSLDHSEHEA